MQTRTELDEELVCATSWSSSNVSFQEDDRRLAAPAFLGTTTWSPVGSVPASNFAFLPDFTEHPKPKKKKRRQKDVDDSRGSEKDNVPLPPPPPPAEDDANEITFFHDFVAGGAAGSASVILGHPFDTVKVRMQTSTSQKTGILHSIRAFGGVSSLFRGMAGPLGTAALVNATVFSSYGYSSKLYDQYITDPREQSLQAEYDDNDEGDNEESPTHDPWQKAMACGSFAGAVECLIICPMEHVKIRLQTQQGKSAADSKYKGPVHAARRIVAKHGVQRLYQGWWSTVMREVPFFALYFATYDFLKDRSNSFLLERDRRNLELAGKAAEISPVLSNTHTWLASAISGGCSGSIAWVVVYPVDLIKSKIQTAPLDTPIRQLSMWNVGKSIVEQQGFRSLFRGLGITLCRSFPVNGTIFPVYEFTLKQVNGLGY